MKVLFCSYRQWAANVLAAIAPCFPNILFEHVDTPERLLERHKSYEHPIVIVAGWSWKVPTSIVNSSYVVGIHPSDLPAYAGGSPIQHQILDGLRESVVTLFKLSEKLDAGLIVSKREYSLEGHLDKVLENIAEASSILIRSFLENWPNITTTEQTAAPPTRKRLKPESSKLQKNEIATMTTRQLWDTIRCHEHPYPNVYIEDDVGKLTIISVKFEPKM